MYVNISCFVVDSVFSKPAKEINICQYITYEGLNEYIESRLILFGEILQENFDKNGMSFENSDDAVYKFVWEHFSFYEPLINMYQEFTPLRFTTPSLLSKSANLMQSAPVGMLHMQLRIGGLLFSWNQNANADAVDTGFNHLSEYSPVVRIPLRLYHVSKKWIKLFCDWLKFPDAVNLEIDCACRIASEFMQRYETQLPDIVNLSKIVLTWEQRNYQPFTQNCQDFALDAITSLNLKFVGNQYSAPLSTYINNLYANPSNFGPLQYGRTWEQFIDHVETISHHEYVDYYITSCKWFLCDGKLSRAERTQLLKKHAHLLQIYQSTEKAKSGMHVITH